MLKISSAGQKKIKDFLSPIPEQRKVNKPDDCSFFGCEAYFKAYGVASNEARARRGIFLGIDPKVKGWLFLDIDTRQIIVSRCAVFNEWRYPFIDMMKPCLIILKFGVWPKIHDNEVVTEPIRISVMGGVGD